MILSLPWKILRLIFSTSIILICLYLSLQYSSQVKANPVNVVVSGTIFPQPSDYEITITAIDPEMPSGGKFPQWIDITYKIQVTSHTAATFPTTVLFNWDKGVIQESGGTKIDVLRYQPGSATVLEGMSPPIIDQNTYAQWTFPALSMNTPATQSAVQIKLYTRGDYQGNKVVTMPLRASITNPSQSNEVLVTYYYQFDPTKAVASTPAPVSQASPTPAPAPIISSVTVIERLSNQARVLVETRSATRTWLRYGINVNSLQIVPSQVNDRLHFYLLENLKPSTQYYVQAGTGEASSILWNSEVTPFTTGAINLSPVTPISDSVIVSTNQGLELYKAKDALAEVTTQGSIPEPTVVISDSVLAINVAIENKDQLKTASVFSRQQLIQGTSTDELDESVGTQSTLTNTAGKQFVAKVRMPHSPGKYDLILRTEDFFNNVREQKIGDLLVVPPLVVQANNTNLSEALITLYKWNPKTKLFEMLPTSITQKNPFITSNKGTLNTNLFAGKYKAEIQKEGYESSTVEFDISANNPKPYPSISLRKLPFSWSRSILQQLRVYGWLLAGQFILNLVVVLHYREQAKRQQRREYEGQVFTRITHSLYDMFILMNIVFCAQAIYYADFLATWALCVHTAVCVSLWLVSFFPRIHPPKMRRWLSW